MAVALWAGLALVAGTREAGAQGAADAAARPRVAVLPFQVFSARPQGYLEQSLADLLTTRLEASGQVEVLEASTVRESVVAHAGERSDATVRRIARDVRADQVVAGSLTELAGRYSLDVKVVPAREGETTRTLVFTAEGEPELLDRVNELADRVLEVAGGAPAQGRVAEVRIEGVSEQLAAELPDRLRLKRGTAYESSAAREDLRTLRGVPGIAAADVDTERGPQGVIVTYRLVPSERLIPASPLEKPGDLVADVQVRGNRRIEANAIKARVATKPGQPFNPETVARDVREVYGLGFFRNVRVATERGPKGRVLVFEVEENPVVRQVTVTGNESIDSEKIRDTLTLTTGSTLDYPLLFENRERVEALYRAQGYYLARVTHRIEELSGDAVSIDFEVSEGDKLPLDRIEFEGNEYFSQEDLEDSLKTKRRRWYSIVTKYLDKSGTYSEPVFIQDLQKVNEKYTNEGYIQAEVGDPRVSVVKDASGDDALAVEVEIREGPQYRVGKVDVQGDPSLDVPALRQRIKLKEGEIFNRSSLTGDVEDLERYYTDRGFFYASISPRTNLEESDLTVDVAFDVKKGDLHFIREIDVTGNTNTRDEVVRREMRVVEGQLYSARQVNRSRDRVKRLGFFEDVEFEAKATDYQEQLDLDLKVVERPTGSLSFGVGYSTQDSLVLSGSVSQSNLFGRGYGVQLVVDYGSRNSQFYVSFFNPYLFGSGFSLRTTAFRTDLEYIDFEQTELGVEISLGHDLNEAGTARGNLRYSYATRDIERLTNENAASMIYRELLGVDNDTSLFGLSWISDTRDDFVAPKSGHIYGANLEYAGLGGFANFLRLEGRALWFVQPPDWFPTWFPFRDESTFVFGLRAGYTLPFNDISDYSFSVPNIPTGPNSNAQPLANIDTDLELPLSERYFLGGLGSYQLRGYRARSVGPRRAILQRSGLFGTGTFFYPVGRQLSLNESEDFVIDAVCFDEARFGNQGDGDGECNSLFDEDIDDFDDLDETDVIGGNKFISASFEYRFPVSKELGLVGILFLDMGNAFDETQSIFDFGEFRFGTGIGALWFSPFGPLQAFVGFPLNKLEVEDSTTFEFSVGGSAY